MEIQKLEQKVEKLEADLGRKLLEIHSEDTGYPWYRQFHDPQLFYKDAVGKLYCEAGEIAEELARTFDNSDIRHTAIDHFGKHNNARSMAGILYDDGFSAYCDVLLGIFRVKNVEHCDIMERAIKTGAKAVTLSGASLRGNESKLSKKFLRIVNAYASELGGRDTCANQGNLYDLVFNNLGWSPFPHSSSYNRLHRRLEKMKSLYEFTLEKQD